ncbi:MAG: asparagine synthase (glutamine-hydrolyzing) [Jatrophihabitantaceae bacterium]
MCGIAGVAVLSGAPLDPRDRVALRAMSGAIAHRGPDGDSLFEDHSVGLAFRRLALVAPDSGDQPLFDSRKDVVLVANGEVYNHKELRSRLSGNPVIRTRSDCEVLAHLYAERGTGFLDEVRGLIAVALWDRARNRIVLARDRFGIKPLFFSVSGGRVVFGSEIKALFAHPAVQRRLDWEGALRSQVFALDSRLATDPATSWFVGVEAVAPGTVVTIDLGTGAVTRHEYWALPAAAAAPMMSDEQYIAEYHRLLVEAVDEATTSDTEIGLFLSGGIDSMSIAAIAGELGRPLHTFSVLSGSTLASGDAEFAHLAAQHTGMTNHFLAFEPSETPNSDEWRALLWLLETPLCTAEHFYKYYLHRLAKSVRPELRGMMLGQGSDEFNGGYADALSDDTNGWDDFERIVRRLAERSAAAQAGTLSSWWNRDDPLLSGALLEQYRLPADPYQDYLRWRLRFVEQYQCWHEDRTAAGNGIEGRVPFFDHRLVELSVSVPAARRADLFWQKRILRDGMRKLLPAEIFRRPKVSFYAGQGAYYATRLIRGILANDDGALVEQALSTAGAGTFLNVEAIRRKVATLDTTCGLDDAELLLRLVNLGLLEVMCEENTQPSLLAASARDTIEVTVSDWARDCRNLEARYRPLPDEKSRPVLPLTVQLLRNRQDDLIIAYDGELQFEVTAEDAPELHAVLPLCDGELRVDEIGQAVGLPTQVVAAQLREAVEAGVCLTEPEPVDAMVVRA